MSSWKKDDEEVKKNRTLQNKSDVNDQSLESIAESTELEVKTTDVSEQVHEISKSGNEDVSAYFEHEGGVVSRLHKTQMSKYKGHIVIAVTAVLFIALLSFFFIKDSDEAIVQAETAVGNVYFNDEQSFLKENIRQEDFELARQVVNNLTWRRRKPYLEELEMAQAKFDALTRLNGVFQSEERLVNGNQQVLLEDLVLVSDVTKDYVKELIKSRNATEEDDMWDVIHAYQNYAMESLSQIDLMKERLAALPNEVGNRAALTKVVDQVVELEAVFQPLAKHPQMSEVNQLFQEYANTIGQVFVAGAEFGDYEAALIEAMYDSKVLAKSLVGTPYDRSPLIALTFDDGPNDVFTPQLLDVLARHDVKATFFVMGAYVDDFPEVSRRIVAEGHTIANHTYSHPDLSKSTDEEVLQQMQWAQESINDVTGVWPDLYRLPFGAGGKRVIDLLPEMTSILWNIDSYDWESSDVDVIYETITNQLHHHSLLLMHDTHQATPDTIDRLIPYLKEQGYAFVSPEALDFDMRYFAE